MATVTLGSKAVGSIVTLKENGVSVDYLVVHQGLPSSLYDTSCDGAWLLRKELVERRQWHGSEVNDYAASTIKAYLDSTFLTRFDANIRNAIKQVKIPYRPGSGTSTGVNSGTNGLSCKIFLLSGYEVGWTYSDSSLLPPDGAKLAYFEAGDNTSANNKRIAYLNGGAASWWLRSPFTHASTYAWLVYFNDGYDGYNSSSCFNSCGVRPALVLPSSLLVSDDGSVSTNTVPDVPASITVPASVRGGSTLAITWASATDADGNLAGYRLERQVDGGAWSQIYQGVGLSFTDNITRGWNTVTYRVCAYDTENAASGYVTSPTRVVINNTAPTAPPSINVPVSPRGGQTCAISWSASTDADNNLTGYKLERQVDSGAWSQVYAGAASAFTDTLTRGWKTVAYRVRAYDALNEHSGYTASPTRTLINNSPPVVSGADEALGIKNETFSKAYTVSDPEGDGITVTELLDGKALRTFAATAGAEHTATLDEARMQKLLNGSHTLAVRAADTYAGGSMQSTRSWTFEKQVHRLTARSVQPFPATEMPTRCIINVGRQVPFGATFKVEVCNNGFDVEPAWEDCTAQVENGRKYMFTNSTKTAESWGVHVRVTLERNSAVGDCYITGIGGNFE